MLMKTNYVVLLMISVDGTDGLNKILISISDNGDKFYIVKCNCKIP